MGRAAIFHQAKFLDAKRQREMRIFVWPVRVYYEDTDSGGVVYYANYLKFMERARSEWLRALGVEQDELISGHNVLFAVRAVQVDYLRPARFNELLAVTAEVAERGRASLTFKQSVLRVNKSGPGALALFNDNDSERMLADNENKLCTGRIKIACLNAATLRPCPIPTHLITEMSRDG